MRLRVESGSGPNSTPTQNNSNFGVSKFSAGRVGRHGPVGPVERDGQLECSRRKLPVAGRSTIAIDVVRYDSGPQMHPALPQISRQGWSKLQPAGKAGTPNVLPVSQKVNTVRVRQPYTQNPVS